MQNSATVTRGKQKGQARLTASLFTQLRDHNFTSTSAYAIHCIHIFRDHVCEYLKAVLLPYVSMCLDAQVFESIPAIVSCDPTHI